MHSTLLKRANVVFYEEMCINFLLNYKTLPLEKMYFKITTNEILPTLSLRASEYYILNLNEKDINELAESKGIDIYEALYEKIIYELYHIIYLAKVDIRKEKKNNNGIDNDGDNKINEYSDYDDKSQNLKEEKEKLKEEIKQHNIESLYEYKQKKETKQRNDFTKKDEKYDIKDEYKKIERKIRNKNIIDYFKKHLDKKLEDVSFKYGYKTTLSYKRINNRREENDFLLPGVGFTETANDLFFKNKGVVILVDYSGSTNDYNDLLNDFCFDMSKKTSVYLYNDKIYEYSGRFMSSGNTSIIKAINNYISDNGDSLFKNNYIYVFTDGIDKYDELIRKYDLDIFRYDMRNYLVEYKRYYNKGKNYISEEEKF